MSCACIEACVRLTRERDEAREALQAEKNETDRLTAERDAARARAREACQRAVAVVGADGPCDVVEAVERLAECHAEIERERDDLRAELALLRLRDPKFYTARTKRAVNSGDAGHEWAPHEREGWSVCSRCGLVRNYDRERPCRGVMRGERLLLASQLLAARDEVKP